MDFTEIVIGNENTFFFATSYFSKTNVQTGQIAAHKLPVKLYNELLCKRHKTLVALVPDLCIDGSDD